jgi:oxygen-independent coproporphyrinogen-3 oxidase
VEYLGIGPGAHSFNGTMRRWCEQRVEEYVDGVVYDSEVLSGGDRFNEYVMTSLRCAEGIDMGYLASRFGEVNLQKIVDGAGKWLLSGDILLEDNRLRIPVDRFLISDAIIESLFEV